MNVGDILADVLLNGGDPDLATSRVGCQAIASRQMFCGCGAVLDMETVTLITVKTPIRRIVVGQCPTCYVQNEPDYIDAAKLTGTPIVIEDWNGVKFRQGEVD